MAQLVEQRIRNAWVAGSSPASGSLSWYPLGTSFFLYYRITPSPVSWTYLERPQGSWNHLEPSGMAAGQAAGLLPRGRLLPIFIVNTYERSYESEGLAIGGQYGWVDDATRWHKECETYQRQPKQGGNDCYHQLHPRAVVSFHRRLNLEQRPWNARSASGTPSGLLEQPIGLLERAKRY